MKEISQLLSTARDNTILVLGDLMLDEWIIGDASRISPEAPVPVVRLSERRIAPGGAANVAMNLLSLGASVRMCGMIGDDKTGNDLVDALKTAGADVGGIVRDSTRPTSLKTRVLASRQQMLRIDQESDETFSPYLQDRLEVEVARALHDCDTLCVSDYDKGLVSCGVAERIIQTAIQKGCVVTGGPKPPNYGCFEDATFLSLNEKEAAEAAGFKINSDEAAIQAGRLLQGRIKVKTLAITRGGKGVLLFTDEKEPTAIPAHSVEVFDVAGAGDTFLAAATFGLAAGADFVQAATLGNLAAAASVRHVGVVAVTPEEILRIEAE